MPILIDIAVILILGLFAWIGAKRGFIKTFMGTFSLALSIIISKVISDFLSILPNDTTFLVVLIIAFATLSLLLALITKILNLAAKLPIVSTVNKILGLLCGIIFGFFAIMVIGYYLVSSNTITTDQINDTFVLNFISTTASTLLK